MCFRLRRSLPSIPQGISTSQNPSSGLVLSLLLVVSVTLTGCAGMGGSAGLASVHPAERLGVHGERLEVARAQNASGYGPNAGLAGLSERYPQVEYGKPNFVVDGVGWLLAVPEKIVLLDSRAMNHRVKPETVEVVQQYLAENQAAGVKIRVNQYAPIGEWKRLAKNKRVNPVIRYTFGAWRTFGYTLVPGRLFGRDNYNPYTDTLSLYSDSPAMAVHEGAYAVDSHQRRTPGLYGIAQGIPLINIWHESKATSLSREWLLQSNNPELVAEADGVVPPLTGMRIARSLLPPPFFRSGAEVIGAATGHVAGAAMRFGRGRSNKYGSEGYAADPRAAERVSGGVVPVSHAERLNDR